jgi:hypothetical protein
MTATNVNINSDFKLSILNSENVNDEIIAYKIVVQNFLSTADKIMISDL